MGAALARAYAVVREWGGELGFESEAPRGSTFTMYLPLAEPEAEPKTASAPRGRSGCPARNHTGGG